MKVANRPKFKRSRLCTRRLLAADKETVFMPNKTPSPGRYFDKCRQGLECAGNGAVGYHGGGYCDGNITGQHNGVT